MKVILTILVILAALSGITKVLLMEQEMTFFGNHGFTSAMIVAFGVVQLAGAALMVFRRRSFPAP